MTKPRIKPVRDDLLTLAMDLLGDDYRSTSDPVYLWRMYAKARAARVQIPDVVLDYFDRCAVELEKATTSAEVADAVGLRNNKRGGGSRRWKREQFERDERVVQFILNRMDQRALDISSTVRGALALGLSAKETRELKASLERIAGMTDEQIFEEAEARFRPVFPGMSFENIEKIFEKHVRAGDRPKRRRGKQPTR